MYKPKPARLVAQDAFYKLAHQDHYGRNALIILSEVTHDADNNTYCCIVSVYMSNVLEVYNYSCRGDTQEIYIKRVSCESVLPGQLFTPESSNKINNMRFSAYALDRMS